ncbi:MAG: 1-phosphofructokinase family hexose kinase [Isosphaeraceae bacterium]
MILCVTLNPCLDKTLTVPPWRPGDSVRGTAAREVVGGKGNNVARALSRLDRKARPVTFLGGPTGHHCETLLRREDGLDPLVVRTISETRVILTVRTEGTNEQSAFFDPDPAVTENEAEEMFRGVEAALGEGTVKALTLSGSSPSTATHGLYSDLISLANARNLPVFLDTYGPPLDAIWGFWPQSIQLNRREIATHLRKPAPAVTDRDVLSLLARWAGHGVSRAVVTDGPNPALARLDGVEYRVIPPSIEAVNPIGSGDCLMAGLADGWLSGLSGEALIRHAFGCALANALVWDAGAIDPAVARIQGESVTIETIAEPNSPTK